MQYLPFGNTTMNVSRLCLGSMTFSRELDLATTRLVVDEALDHGINFIDTAESYGESEDFLGQVLQRRRERVYIASKVYTQRADVAGGEGGHGGRNSRDNILFTLERSLRLLRTDHVDLFQLHHPDPATPLEETLETLDAIVKQGKARYIGVSNHYAWQAAYMLERARGQKREAGAAGGAIISIQFRYNILDRIAEVETLPMARSLGLATMIYAPLCAGMLTGKYQRGQMSKPGTRAQQNKKLQELLKNDAAFELIDRLKEVAAQQNLALNQLAWLWLLSKPDVTTPILGGSKPEHFRSVYKILDRALPSEVVKQIDDLSAGFVYRRWENQPVVDGPPV